MDLIRVVLTQIFISTKPVHKSAIVLIMPSSGCSCKCLGLLDISMNCCIKAGNNCISIYLEQIALEKNAEQKLSILYNTYSSSKSLETTIAMPADCLRTTTEGRIMRILRGKSRCLLNPEEMKFGLFSRRFSCKNFREKCFASPFPVGILSLQRFSIK